MNLRVIKPGLMDTIQDMGRYGWQHLGINPGGVMDKLSSQIANILVGNDSDEAVVELHFPAGAFFFEQPSLIAVTGADFTPCVNGEEVLCMRPVMVSKYSILQFQNIKKGARAYLAVHGGLKVKPWLNSYSTNLKAVAGGVDGRVLQKDDEIAFRMEIDLSQLLGKKEFEVLSWKADDDWDNDERTELRALAGNEWNRLDDQSKDRFFEQSFNVTSHSDRMGYHLRGQAMSTLNNEEMVSSAVSFGTVQLLPDGQLIVLMADHQTTGGYPRLAHVISVDHSKLAQMKPGDQFRFRFTDQQTAEQLFIRQQQHLLQLENACKFKLEQLLGK